MSATSAGPKPVAVYLRYSSKMQDENSLAYQLSAAESYCSDHNMIIAAVYADPACSGTTGKRPDFQRMISDAKNNPEWKDIVVFKLSRWFRNAFDQARYEAELKKHGITIISITEEFADTPLGRHERRVQASHNQLVSEEIGEHTFSGQKEKASQGIHVGGRPPLGYKIENQRLVIDEHDAETVRQIFDMYDKGYSYRKIAKHLNEQGRRTSEGEQFSKNSFNSILSQEKYTGVYVWNKASKKSNDGSRNSHKFKPLKEQIHISGGCPAIIDRETFDRIQTKMKSRSGGNRNRYHYMLSGLGLLKCAHCGHLLEGSVRTAHNGNKYTVYACPNHRNNKCPTKEIRTECLDEAVAKALIYRRFKRQDLPALNSLVTMDNEIKRLQKRQKELKCAIASNLRLFEKGPSDILEARYYENTDELKEVGKKLESLQGSGPLITEENVGRVIRRFKDYLKTSDDPAVRDYLRKHIGYIRYSNDKTSIEINTGSDEAAS